MSPQIALLVFGSFILGVLIVDSRLKRDISVALWIPLIWLAILASRPVVQWFYPGATLNADAFEDGNPVDRTILSVLMVIAAFVLFKRKLRWSQWLRENSWLFLFFLFCGLSIVWSEFPVVAIKRWIRALGSLMMILVVLSEADPIAAVGALVRRCAYVLIPLSVLLIKYYREMAVGYNQWTGQEMLFGVTTDKNALGRLCLVSGLFILWDIITTRHNKNRHRAKLNRVVSIIMFVMIVWLLVNANSATSLVSFVVGSCAMIGLGLIRRRVRHIVSIAILTSAVVLILGLLFNPTNVVVTSLGRDMTLTERTDIWKDLMNTDTNPLLGVGYDSFWLGERLKRFWQERQINEAHNGYLEIYLELGAIGLFLFSGFLVSTLARAKRSLMSSFDYGRLRIALLFAFVLYNITEAEYKATTLMYFVVLLVAIDVPRNLWVTTAENSSDPLPGLDPLKLRESEPDAASRSSGVPGSS